MRLPICFAAQIRQCLGPCLSMAGRAGWKHVFSEPRAEQVFKMYVSEPRAKQVLSIVVFPRNLIFPNTKNNIEAALNTFCSYLYLVVKPAAKHIVSTCFAHYTCLGTCTLKSFIPFTFSMLWAIISMSRLCSFSRVFRKSFQKQAEMAKPHLFEGLNCWTRFEIRNAPERCDNILPGLTLARGADAFWLVQKSVTALSA